NGPNDIIPIFPSSRLRRIPLVTIGVGITNEVQPVPAPPLAKTGRSEKTVDLALVGVGRFVVLERLDVFKGRGETGDVVIESANYFGRRRRWRELEVFLTESILNKRVNLIFVCRFRVLDLSKRNARPLHRLQ